ncbi:AAA+-type ATPase [Emydomyces testavorans]|uniref:AAA+-type ATPase n=1 Tax=Emydomyces testavorans TaxID=2070801 RepID=A0AAF0DPM4_9EURO|nr:AAA+-type ATPase [Emydomyces testavorans]
MTTMLRSNPGPLMQKTYDESYLMSSTAVYFERQNNEEEALRSWRESLETIYRCKASISSSYVPQNETERALQKSIQELEMQCKERIDLLEALRESRKTAGLDAGKSTTGLRGKFGIGRKEPVGSSVSFPGWIGDGTVPSLGYPDLPRPSLPPRPQALDSNRGSSAATAPTLSRSSSSDKRKPLLTTLRGSKDKKSTSEVKSASSRQASRPAASQAADLAWNAVSPRPAGPVNAQSSPGSEFASRKAADSGPRPEINSKKSENPAANLAAGAAAVAIRRPGETELPPEDLNSSAALCHNQDTNGELSGKPSLVSKSGAPASAYPAYRKEFPESGNTPTSAPATPQVSRTFSSSLSQRRESSPKHSRGPGAAWTSKSSPISKKSERVSRPGNIGSNGKYAKQNIRGGHSRPAKNAFAQPGIDPAHSPSRTPGVGDQLESDEEEDPFSEEMRTDKDFCNIMKNLPKGVDRNAAGQILHEIVVRGDEVHWDDIAGLEAAKKALKEAVVYPFLRPDLFMGLREPARGMLLFGPPGTGKTMLARAVATESKSTFFSISATSLTSKWHGESEKLVRALFSLAKAMAPSIIFVDEIDSLLSSRLTGDHDATRRSKTQFLIEWSDLQRAAAGREQSSKEKAEGDATRVLVLGATNMPWDIDDAARRRFVRRQYIPLPEADVRKLQLQKLLSHQKHELSEDDIDVLVKVTDGFSGSDITALAKDAAMGPLRNLGEALLDTPMDEICPIRFRDFESSLYSIRPSVSRERLKEYEKWAQEFGERGS